MSADYGVVLKNGAIRYVTKDVAIELDTLRAALAECRAAEEEHTSAMIKLTDEFKAEIRAHAECRAVLREVEWGESPVGEWSSCPYCLNHRPDGHATDCLVARVLTDKP